MRDVLTVDEVVSSGSSLLGEPVSVSGYLRFGDDSRSLWASASAYAAVADEYLELEDPAWDRCITLIQIGNLREELLSKNGRVVILTGVIRRLRPAAGSGNLTSCSNLGISVDRVQVLR